MSPRTSLALAFVLALLALGQTGCATAAELCVYVARAAFDYALSKLGEASQPSDCTGNANSGDPALQTQGLSPARTDICATPYDGSDPCVACVRAQCCAELLACTRDYTCTCTLARREGKFDWPEEAECGDPTEVYYDAETCLYGHCAEACQMPPRPEGPKQKPEAPKPEGP